MSAGEMGAGVGRRRRLGRDGLLFALRLALGLGLLVVSLWKVDWAGLGAALARVNVAWLAAALVSVLASAALKVIRWGALLRGLGVQRVPGGVRLGGAFLIGQAANIVLPFRGGEVARIGWLSVEARQDAMRTGLSVILEKYLDLIGLLGLLFWLGPFLPIDLIERSRNWLLPLCAAATVLLVAALWLGPALWRGLSRRLASRAPEKGLKVLHRVDRMIEEIAQLRSLAVFGKLLAFTVLIWAVMLATNLLVFLALGLALDVRAAGLVLGLAYIGVAPAFMPGNIGPFYFFAMLALEPFGVAQTERAAFAMLLHALVVLPPLLLSGVYILASRWMRGRGP